MIIYKAKNIITGKVYIGKTINSFKTRLSSHLSKSKSVGRLGHFYNSIRRYGWNAFEWSIICECDTKDELDEMEFHYIKQYRMATGVYNLTDGGDCGPVMFGEDNPMYGKKRPEITGDLNPAKTPEVRKKISEANSGCKRPDLSKKNKENAGKTFDEIYGIVKAEEIRAKFKLRKTKDVIYHEVISPDGEVMLLTIKEMCDRYGLKQGSVHDLFSGRNKSGKHKGWTRI